jgi:hypothetical protein
MGRPLKLVHIYCDDPELAADWAFSLRIGRHVKTAVFPVSMLTRRKNHDPDARLFLEPEHSRAGIVGESCPEAKWFPLSWRDSIMNELVRAAVSRRGPTSAAPPAKWPPASERPNVSERIGNG